MSHSFGASDQIKPIARATIGGTRGRSNPYGHSLDSRIRTVKKHSYRFLSLTLCAASLASQDAGHRLDPQRFGELLEQLSPKTDAPWRSIPWRIDLLAAQHEAAAERKPLFIWAMDGHPLGCT